MPKHPGLGLSVPRALAETADRLKVPEGFRVEIIEGNMVVVPTPQGRHGLTTRRLRHALLPTLPAGMVDMENITLLLPETEQRYVPDVVVMPEDVLDSAEWLFPADVALLVVEITSPNNRDTDLIRKLRGYATSMVPNYLLVDRAESIVTLFSEPEGRVYRQHVQVPFGKPIELPAPFDGALSTANFV